MPSHMDIEGNELADRLAKEGVKRHGVILVEESRKVEQPSNKKNREEVEQVEMKDRRCAGGR